MIQQKQTTFFQKLKNGLARTRENLMVAFSGVTTLDEGFYDELEEALIMSDLGVYTTEDLIEQLKENAEKKNIVYASACKREMVEILKAQMPVDTEAYTFEDRPSVVFVLGVNGVGKTTTIGKISADLKRRGKRVCMAACDTFRAAAIDQLEEWSNRANVPIIKHTEGSDPSAVLFDALQSVKARNTDILLCDTAGRLHNKKNLMEELKKMDRIIDREYPDAYRENLLVLDATTGQNAMNQAKEFMEVSHITGIVLTKMDGTAKGGMAIAIQKELGIPVKYVGVGEQIDDLQKFDVNDYIDALFDD